ncbi:MAG: methylated-DNA--[protein]-cysteine S-methyltransferase [Candidatus Hydrogenedens sp.]|nr:methylated-DNA--[protein]-cysteine S-methyltransferase [Candidatus Hydrogenedens sp.]
MPNFYDAVYAIVRDIPRGKVMAYGQIATILGVPRAARAVGYALKACDAKQVPWQRVINAQGRISGHGERPALQRALLEKEGIRFDADGACDLKRKQWHPPDPEQYAPEDAHNPEWPF